MLVSSATSSIHLLHRSPSTSNLFQKRKNKRGNLPSSLLSISTSTSALEGTQTTSPQTSLPHWFQPQRKIYSEKPVEILPGVYLGDVGNASNVKVLTELNIGFVLNVAKEIDQDNILEYFASAFSFIDLAKSKGQGVLIHCQCGVSRSASLVMGYAMKQLNITFSEAYQLVKSRSDVVSPNLNLLAQLQEFEKARRSAL
ncbi:DSPc-domain-containing protein [Conidiobolus coronatus NRRL 28638]|uniref:protein-tyrosine-phosphatase n=1 Tax=Conidiobolus coronatus (strain ATCC 28846 / CBS 209.66 / NRRL 28638) TaxID=796925 RepID=A0A137P7C7_CONC2|nr:DSPc-domain-containing protein [Conidiobolus coronatus NRRL 28638]|eukprot:KXN70869.1 DSPc-domain-containing protein [Conidiobolus coronatus NRRL 28638]